MIKVSYGLKTLKLVIAIANLTYFLAIFWFIYCNFVEAGLNDNNPIKKPTFITEHELELVGSHIYATIKVIYFTFTTLSTVGFGDVKPHSDYEYLMSAFVMLFGNAVFTYIMTEFLSIIANWKLIGKGLDESDELDFFFKIIEKMNGGTPVPHKIKNDFEHYFEYYWNNNKNKAIGDEEGRGVIDQLPIEV